MVDFRSTLTHEEEFVNEPVVSIVIPTFNRPDQLAGCLGAICSLDYPRSQFEVIVVNDGGVEETETVVRQFRTTITIDYHRIQHGGPATARNHGAQNAHGNFIIFLDDDCRPFPDWLKTMEARLTQNGRAIIAGRAVNGLKDNLYSEASHLLVDHVMSHYNRVAATASFVTSNNMGLERDTFFEVGGFDRDFPVAGGEDREFGDRCRQLGVPVVDCDDVRVIHFHALTLVSFCRQHFNYGRGANTYHRLRSRRTGRGVQLEPLHFYRDLVLHPLSDVAHLRSLFIAGLILGSQIANAAGFVWETIVRSRRPTQSAITPA